MKQKRTAEKPQEARQVLKRYQRIINGRKVVVEAQNLKEAINKFNLLGKTKDE